MKFRYQIITKDQKRLMYLPDVPQYLDCVELGRWLRETRDADPDLYAELVHAYVLMTKPSPAPKRLSAVTATRSGPSARR